MARAILTLVFLVELFVELLRGIANEVDRIHSMEEMCDRNVDMQSPLLPVDSS